MLTFSEIVVTLTIWVLTAAGLFFGLRAVWRRRKNKAQRCTVATRYLIRSNSQPEGLPPFVKGGEGGFWTGSNQLPLNPPLSKGDFDAS